LALTLLTAALSEEFATDPSHYDQYGNRIDYSAHTHWINDHELAKKVKEDNLSMTILGRISKIWRVHDTTDDSQHVITWMHYNEARFVKSLENPSKFYSFSNRQYNKRY
jgi:hypothetical protein